MLGYIISCYRGDNLYFSQNTLLTLCIVQDNLLSKVVKTVRRSLLQSDLLRFATFGKSCRYLSTFFSQMVNFKLKTRIILVYL